jgi:hypothetical protein
MGMGMKIAFRTFLVLFVGGVVTFFGVEIFGGSKPDMSAHAEQDVINTCQDSVRGMLKDPDSARFDGWTAWRSGLSGDALRYSASGMVNAKNGFGGYSGNEPYSCDATVTSGTVNATARAG